MKTKTTFLLAIIFIVHTYFMQENKYRFRSNDAKI
jgi:hypothetical protein